MVADHGGLAAASADGGWHPIIEVYDQPTPKSASRTDREGFTAHAVRMHPEPLLIVPAAPETMERLLLGDLGQRPAVLWLDDIDRYLTQPYLQPWLFRQLAKRQPRVVVLATVTLTQYEALVKA